MFQFLRTMFQTTPLRPRKSASRRLAHGRVEYLESRCLLAFAPLAPDFSGIDNSKITAGVIVSGDRSSELATPSFEENLPSKEIPPSNEAPPTKEIPPYDPPAGDSGKPEDPSWNPIPDAPPWQDPPLPPQEDEPSEYNPGGITEIDNLDSKTNQAPATPSPADVAAQRETRSVLQMLSTLKYSVDQRDSGDPWDAPREETAFSAIFRDLADSLRQQASDTERDGGVVAVAVDAVVAEMDADRDWQPSPELLRDVSVQLDNSSGRYQAFEVSTFDEAALPAASDADQAPAPTTSFEATWNGDELPTADGPSAGESPAAEQAPAVGSVPLSSAPPVDESSKLTWTSAVALITLGIALQFLRDCRLESVRKHAVTAWDRWLASPRWLRRGSGRIE